MEKREEKEREKKREREAVLVSNATSARLYSNGRVKERERKR